MKFAWKKVNERFDALYILHKLIEVDKLKILLLDRFQLNLFDFLPKPIITTELAKKNFKTKV